MSTCNVPPPKKIVDRPAASDVLNVTAGFVSTELQLAPTPQQHGMVAMSAALSNSDILRLTVSDGS
jgi:hypothetical protein